jgi:outer membrane protein assembly factor BamB
MKGQALGVPDVAAVLCCAVGLGCAGTVPSGGPVTPEISEATISEWAGREAEPLWRLGLGPVHVEDMRPVPPNRLLVGLKQNEDGLPNGECLLVDLEAGAVVWRLDRDEKGSYYPVLTQEDLIVFQIEKEGKSALLAIDGASGVERWRTSPQERVSFSLVPDAGVVLVETRNDRRITLSALRLSDGSETWRRDLVMRSEQAPPSRPAVWGDMIWLFYDGVERITTADGSSLWSRPDLRVSQGDTPPQLANRTLYVVQEKALLALDAADGGTRWSAGLGLSPTNIYPDGDIVFVRGELPFRDPGGRFTFDSPTDWPVQEEAGLVYRFQDSGTGAFIVITYYQPGSQLEEVFGATIEGLESISDGRPNRRSQVDTTVGGQPARYATYSFDLKPEEGDKQPWVAYLGAVVNEESGAGVAFVGAVHENHQESAGPSIERALQTMELGRGPAVADAWRQRATTAGGGSYQVTAFSVDDGSSLWRYRTEVPSISNFVTVGGRVYVATATSLIALRRSRGQEAFVVDVTETARPYPGRLRVYDDKVVYIGELVIAAYNITSGAEIYRHGVTPVSQQTSLAGLDNAMPQFEELLAGVRGMRTEEGWAGGMARSAYASYQQYQYYSTAYGDSYAQTQTGMSASVAEFQLNMSLFYTSMEISSQLRQMFVIRGFEMRYRDILARQQLFRSSILSAYALAETGDYVYRPHRRLGASGDADFISLTLIHWPSGQRRTTTVSPTYMNYGLWNYVDLEKGVVYHHGIGLDPSLYEYRQVLPGEESSVNTFLIAAPIRMP